MPKGTTTHNEAFEDGGTHEGTGLLAPQSALRTRRSSTAPPGSKPCVLVTWLTYDAEDPVTGGMLTRAGLTVKWAPKRGARRPHEVAELANGAVGAIVSTDPFDASVFAARPELRVIARVGVGVDSIDLQAATAAGVVVMTTPGCNERTVADHTMAMILGLLRRLVEHDRSVRAGSWSRGGDLTGDELNEMVVGVVGCGAIGGAVVRRLLGFDAEVLICDPQVRHVDGCEVVTLEELLTRAHVVTLHVPLTERTRGMIGDRELAQMRPDALLINTSRGGLIDEHALTEALHERQLAGAALDVFADEPPVESPLLLSPNVLVTPHVGGLSRASIKRMTATATLNLLDGLRGNPRPEMVANPAVLDRLRGPLLLSS